MHITHWETGSQIQKSLWSLEERDQLLRLWLSYLRSLCPLYFFTESWPTHFSHIVGWLLSTEWITPTPFLSMETIPPSYHTLFALVLCLIGNTAKYGSQCRPLPIKPLERWLICPHAKNGTFIHYFLALVLLFNSIFLLRSKCQDCIRHWKHNLL